MSRCSKMLGRILILLVGILHSIGADLPPPPPPSNLSPVEKCMSQRLNPDAARPQTLEALVGIGWDNLINTATTEVYEVTFEDCKTTPDGIFLLPDNVIALPVQQTTFDQTAQVYDTYEAYVRDQSYSINIEATGTISKIVELSPISGSFSYTNRKSKKTFFDHQSTLLVSKMKHHAYTLQAEGERQLAPGFESRLREVADALMANRTTNARYLAELIIRDFGTHVISSSDVGATIEREQYIDSTVKTSNSTAFNEYRVAVSANVGYKTLLNGEAKLSWEKSVSEETAKGLSKETKHVVVRTKGGPKASTTAKEEDVFVIDNLVSFDFRGDFLFTVLHRSRLRFHPRFNDVLDIITNATTVYYARNEIRGCMDRQSPNYNYNANVDDGSCTSEAGKYAFGGFYSVCKVVQSHWYYITPASQCDEYNVRNVATGDFSCDKDFEPVLLLNAPVRLERHLREYYKMFINVVIHWSWTYDVVYQDDLAVSAYWCRPKPNHTIQPTSQQVLFGGLFNDGFPNQITNDFGCPGQYRPIPLFKTTQVCLSRDYQRDSPFAVQLQHFFSCRSPTQNKQCAIGFSQHLAFVFNDCEVYYCVRNEVFRKVVPRPVQRPPFTNPLSMNNLTESSIVVYVGDKLDAIVSLEEVVTKGKEMLKKSNAKILEEGEAGRDSINKAAMEMWMRDFAKKGTEEFEMKREMVSNGGRSWFQTVIQYGVPVLVGMLVVAVPVAAIAGRRKWKERNAGFAPLGDDV